MAGGRLAVECRGSSRSRSALARFLGPLRARLARRQPAILGLGQVEDPLLRASSARLPGAGPAARPASARCGPGSARPPSSNSCRSTSDRYSLATPTGASRLATLISDGPGRVSLPGRREHPTPSRPGDASRGLVRCVAFDLQSRGWSTGEPSRTRVGGPRGVTSLETAGRVGLLAKRRGKVRDVYDLGDIAS